MHFSFLLKKALNVEGSPVPLYLSFATEKIRFTAGQSFPNVFDFELMSLKASSRPYGRQTKYHPEDAHCSLDTMLIRSPNCFAHPIHSII